MANRKSWSWLCLLQLPLLDALHQTGLDDRKEDGGLLCGRGQEGGELLLLQAAFCYTGHHLQEVRLWLRSRSLTCSRLGSQPTVISPLLLPPGV